MSCDPSLHVIQSVPFFQRSLGGIPRSVRDLSETISDLGCRVTVVAPRLQASFGPTFECGNEVDRCLPRGWYQRQIGLLYSPGLRRALRRAVSAQADLLHHHGIWLAPNRIAGESATTSGVPFVLSPRGLLLPKRLEHHRMRKRLLWASRARAVARSASAFHATSSAEADSIRTLGLTQPIAVIPIGMNFSSDRRQPRRRDTKTALFLSTLHPIKGLEDLISAWDELRPSGWRMIVAGPDEVGYRSGLEAEVHRRNLDEVFTFSGSVFDAEKQQLFDAADLFILPSHGESFGRVVLEAMGAGLPVITTQATPWAIIDERACGWCVPVGSGPLREALAQATSLAEDRLLEMGRRAQELARSRFDLQVMGQRFLEFYEWLIGIRPERPSYVYSDM